MDSLEKPALIEKFVQLIPLTYPLAALVWTVIFGFGGPLFVYLDTREIVNFLYPPFLYNTISLALTMFYLFYVTRYLRLRLRRAGNEILPIMPGGEREFNSAFRRLPNPIPPILVAIPLLIVLALNLGPRGPFSNAFFLLQDVVIALGIGNFIWEYSMSNWALHKIGKFQLKLKSFLEDRTMGAKPVGSAALSATAAYLGGLLLLTILGNSNPNINGPGLYAVLGILLSLGVIFFFLPLNSLHDQMRSEKIRLANVLNQRFLSAISANPHDLGDGLKSGANSEDSIAELLRLKRLEIAERKLATAPTWPFDVQVIARLITIVLSVTAVLLSRFITDYLIQIGFRI